MNEAVVITEAEYKKGEHVFSEYRDTINWIPSAEDEVSVCQALRDAGARITVLGISSYRKDLYTVLADNAGSRPALIARHGVGYDGIDLDLCGNHNIFLTITPGALDQSVAEHTIGILLGLARSIPRLDREMRQNEFHHQTGFEIAGKAIGIAGFGNIGKKVALIASRGFGMRVHVFDVVPLKDQAAKEGVSADEFLVLYEVDKYFTDFASFAREVDILSIHIPANERTLHFFNSERLSQLKQGAVLINTSRGSLIDERALYEAFSLGKLKGAAIDVFSREPYAPVSPEHDLRKLPNTVITPHVASDTTEANERMEKIIVENINVPLGEWEKIPRL